MCERDGCQILNQTTTNGCKCQSSFNANNRLQQQPQDKSHHSIKKRKSNVNMQQQHQQISQMEMAFPLTTNINSLVEPNNPSCASISSLDSFVNSYATDCGSSCSSFSSCTTNDATTSTTSPSIGVNLRVTGQCSQGGRKYMEDYFSVAYQQSENAKDLEYAFIGIYDGHGGAEAATFAKEHLMMEIINQKLFWSDSDRDVLRAIREGYIATHYAMWRDQEKWPKTANGLLSTAGTTATIAFIRREKIYIGHVGDSGIVLGYQNENENFWRAKQLTTDHKPESYAERTRIMRSGGKVVVKSGVPRVVWNRPRNAGHKGPIRRSTPIDEVPFLAVARSLGDLWSYNSALNEFVVSPDPDVKVIKINPKTFRCLIFGTDGLWNVVTPQEAVNTVYEKETINERLQAQRGDNTDGGSLWTNPSKGLVEKALKTWSAKKMRADNTSVVTVILYPPGNGEIHSDTGESGGICSTESTLENNTSCGLEYLQMDAEIPLPDCISYRDMAEKYLPPEAYRNFNYYDDENAHNGDLRPMSSQLNTEMAFKYSHSGILEWRNACDKISNAYPTDVDPWSWNARQQSAAVWNATTEIGLGVREHEKNEEVVAAVNTENTENEVEQSDEDNDEEEAAAEHESENTATNYTHYISDTSNSLDTSSTSEHTEANYTNSFAESYNSLLNEQIPQEANSSSNSNPSYQSVNLGTGSSMLAILREQQLYQQQEGYSLTKLETRREQQRCTSGVQTFKIFQQNQEATTENSEEKSPGFDHVSAEQSSNTTHEWEEQSLTPVLSTGISRYILYQQQQQQQQQQLLQPKPLELNSLLEQEREEEQQVALEQMEMQRQLVDVTTESSTSDSINDVMMLQNNEEDALVEEYLDEEITVANDENIQINEVSSSCTIDTSCPILSSSSLTEKNKFVNNLGNKLCPKEKIQCVEKIEKIEILHDNSQVPFAQHEPQVLLSSSTVGLQTEMMYTKRVSVKQTHFPNIPNENQRSSVTASSYSLTKRPRFESFSPLITKCVTAAGGSSRSGGSMEKRQLRSSSGMVDYSKRTLRTRNSLAKDMKAKKPLASSTFKRPSSHMLRKTLTEQRQQHQQHSCSGNTNNSNSNSSSCSKNISNIKNTKSGKLPLLKSSTSVADLTNAINLRSRRIGHLAAAAKSTVALTTAALPSPHPKSTTNNNKNNSNTTASTASTIKRSKSPVLRRERQNIHTKNVAKVISPKSNLTTPSTTIPTNFSKSTRMQSSVNTFTLQPPSPKLMNSSVAAVAAATRARSLLAKNALAAKKFSQRVSLRSNQCNAAGGIAGADVTLKANACLNSGPTGVGAGASTTRGSCRVAKKRRINA